MFSSSYSFLRKTLSPVLVGVCYVALCRNLPMSKVATIAAGYIHLSFSTLNFWACWEKSNANEFGYVCRSVALWVFISNHVSLWTSFPFAMKLLGNIYHNISIFIDAWLLKQIHVLAKIFVKYIDMHVISNLSNRVPYSK